MPTTTEADIARQPSNIARCCGSPALSEGERNSIAVAAAACDLKLKRLTPAEARRCRNERREWRAAALSADGTGEGPRRTDGAEAHCQEMETRFPQSPWLAEALFSSGNMYLLKRDYPTAVEYYGYLAVHFPGSKNAAAAHWRAGWLSYRQGLTRRRRGCSMSRSGSIRRRRRRCLRSIGGDGFTRRRIISGAGGGELSGYCSRVSALLLCADGAGAAGGAGQYASRRLRRNWIDSAAALPVLVESFPSESPHLAKARLLANAGLNEYIAQEIAADPDSSSWSSLAEAQIYASYGETFRALRAIKRALPYAASAPIRSIPLAYWRILFPEPWWDTIKAESAKNNLDPYLVASLIRQESEFDPRWSRMPMRRD